MVSEFLAIAFDGMVDADLQRANAGNVKIIDYCIHLIFSVSMFTMFALLSVLMNELPLFDGD